MGLFRQIGSDLNAVFERDPAARNTLEVIFTYPGFHAIILHRIAHWFWTHNLQLVGRIVSHMSRFLTGIEIHPGAQIGDSFFIDHGMGVVIGETSEIKENVTLYHGVTLGGTSFTRGKRHPTIESNVIIGAGAKVLGPLTVGENSKVGANSVVISDVPPNCSVVGVPGKAIFKEDFPVYQGLEHNKLPDPEELIVESLRSRVQDLENRIEDLKNEMEGNKKQKGTSRLKAVD